MGYTFRIGTVDGQKKIPTNSGEQRSFRPAHEDVDEPPWRDEYEAPAYGGSSIRMISYSTWSNVMDGVSSLGVLFRSLERIYGGDMLDRDYIKVSKYAHRLKMIEEEAEDLLEGEPRLDKDEIKDRGPLDSDMYEEHSSEEAACAVRALWFVKWSRKALRMYGEDAVFETPGEWK